MAASMRLEPTHLKTQNKCTWSWCHSALPGRYFRFDFPEGFHPDRNRNRKRCAALGLDLLRVVLSLPYLEPVLPPDCLPSVAERLAWLSRCAAGSEFLTHFSLFTILQRWPHWASPKSFATCCLPTCTTPHSTTCPAPWLSQLLHPVTTAMLTPPVPRRLVPLPTCCPTSPTWRIPSLARGWNR